jgi:sulfur carrier protein
MTIVLNGADAPAAASVADLLERHLGVREPHGVAVAIDGEVVPRATWPYRPLVDGAVVEIVTAVQGG